MAVTIITMIAKLQQLFLPMSLYRSRDVSSMSLRHRLTPLSHGHSQPMHWLLRLNLIITHAGLSSGQVTNPGRGRGGGHTLSSQGPIN